MEMQFNQETISGDFLHRMFSFKIKSCMCQKIFLKKVETFQDENWWGKRRHEKASRQRQAEGPTAPSPSACVLYLTPIHALPAPIWFFFLIMKLEVGWVQKQPHIYCVWKSPQISSTLELHRWERRVRRRSLPGCGALVPSLLSVFTPGCSITGTVMGSLAPLWAFSAVHAWGLNLSSRRANVSLWRRQKSSGSPAPT